MIKHVPFEALNDEHVELLAHSLLAAPKDNRPDSSDLLRCIWQKKLFLFEFEGGIVLCGKRDNRLTMDAFAPRRGWLSPDLTRLLADDLKRLAADWECDTIETLVYDSRFASAIERLGGRVESYTMTLPVELNNGQQ